MTTRTRLLITAALVCHVLVAPQLVTSQLLPSKQPENSPSSSRVNRPTVPVTIVADRQEKDGAVYKLSGNIKIDYGVYTFSGDEGTYNSDTADVFAEGHLVLEGGPNDEHIEAARGGYNLQSETGKFEDVTGTVGLKFRRNHAVLTGPNTFFFHGRTVEKAGPDHYIVTDGTITTCQLDRKSVV